MDNAQSLYWFALQTTHNRELILKKQLEEQKVECFVPMKYEKVIKDEQKWQIEVPAIHNLIFVHSTRMFLDRYLIKYLKESSTHYVIDLGTKEPIIIPDTDMRYFITVTSSYQDELIYLNDSIEKFSNYDKVRVTGGLFEGIEGYFVRIRKDRKVVISLNGIAAVAISGIHHSLIETI